MTRRSSTSSSCFIFIIFFFSFFSVHARNSPTISLRNINNNNDIAGSPRRPEFLPCTKVGKKAMRRTSSSTVNSVPSAGSDLSENDSRLGCRKSKKKMKGLMEEIKYFPTFRFMSLEKTKNSNWKYVPRNKQHDLVHKHPGFYSDYSRPRIRPPSHN